jgi:hypothetical protein
MQNLPFCKQKARTPDGARAIGGGEPTRNQNKTGAVKTGKIKVVMCMKTKEIKKSNSR